MTGYIHSLRPLRLSCLCHLFAIICFFLNSLFTKGNNEIGFLLFSKLADDEKIKVF